MFNTGIIENAKQGMICLLEDDIGEIISETVTVDYLERGTPVKIVDIKKEVLPIAEWEEPRFRCTLVVEDNIGRQWNIYDSDGEFPVCVLEEGDGEHLLSDAGYKHYKKAKWTDNGCELFYMPPAVNTLILSFLSFAFAQESFLTQFGITFGTETARLILKIVLYTLGILAGVFGVVRIIAGYSVHVQPLTAGELWFYRNYDRTSLELRELLSEYQARHR